MKASSIDDFGSNKKSKKKAKYNGYFASNGSIEGKYYCKIHGTVDKVA